MKHKQLPVGLILVGSTAVVISLMVFFAVKKLGYFSSVQKTQHTVVINTPQISPTEAPTATPTITPVFTPQMTETATEAPTATPTPILTPTPAPTPIVTAEPISDIVETTSEFKSSSPTTQYFETNKIYVTAYSYTDKEHPDGAGYYYYDHGAFNKHLIGICDDSVEEDGYIVHSIATNNFLLPAGSIIYIVELDKYFRVDDNSSERVMQLRTQTAWNKGCSLWIDIYVHKEAYEGKNGVLYNISDKLKPYTDLILSDVLTFELIRYGK